MGSSDVTGIIMMLMFGCIFLILGLRKIAERLAEIRDELRKRGGPQT